MKIYFFQGTKERDETMIKFKFDCKKILNEQLKSIKIFKT